MEGDVLWKAAEKRVFPQHLENAPQPPPAFPTPPTASAIERERGQISEEQNRA